MRVTDARATAPLPTPARASSDGSAQTARGACACPAACTALARSPSSAAATRATPDSIVTNASLSLSLSLLSLPSILLTIRHQSSQHTNASFSWINIQYMYWYTVVREFMSDFILFFTHFSNLSGRVRARNLQGARGVHVPPRLDWAGM